MNLLLKMKIMEVAENQWKFAQSIGLHPSYLSQIIRGARPAPKELQQKIAKALGCSVEEIFQEA